MPAIDWTLLLGLAAVLLVAQGVCWLLARGLALRLGRGVVIAGLLLPLATLWPWLDSRSRLLVPCDVLRGPVPGAPQVGAPDRHSLLNDAVYQFLPWELEVRHAFAAGRLPLWSDLLEGGSSPWTNPQAGVLSPIAMLARPFPLQHHLLAALALKVLVAFEGAWLLARRAGAGRFAAHLAGAGFCLGGGVMSWALFPHTATVAWVPWLAVAVIELVRPRPGGPSRQRAVAVAAVATAFLLLSGHPETAAIGGLFAGLVGLSLARRREGLRGLGRALTAAGVAALLGFGLAAVHLLPFAHLLPMSQRAHETLAAELPAYWVEARKPATWFLPGYAAFLLGPTNPHAYGRPYRDPFTGPINQADAGSGYAGLVALAGSLVALAGLVLRGRRAGTGDDQKVFGSSSSQHGAPAAPPGAQKPAPTVASPGRAKSRLRRAVPFLGFAVLALLLAGRFLPFALFTQAVPPLRTMAYSRFLLVGSLALAIAGALGMDRLLRARRGRWAALAGLAVAAAISLWVAADARVLGLWALLAAAPLLAWWRPRLGAVAVALALLLDLVPWARSVLPSGHPGLFYPQTEFVAELAREAGNPAVHRAVGAALLVYPSLLSVYDVAEVRPHNPLAPMDQLRVLQAGFSFAPSTTTYFSSFGYLDHPLLDFLGVKAVVASVAVPKPETLELVDGGRYHPFFIYRNPDPLPRWFLPAAVDAIGRQDLWVYVRRLRQPARVAVYADEAGAWRPAGTGGRHAVPRVLAAEPGRVVLNLPPAASGTPDASGDRLLATSLPLPGGWRASAGGRRLPTLTVNGAFLGVRVPAAAARVELTFIPPGLVPGLIVSLAAAALVALLSLRRPRRRGPTARPAVS